MGSSSNPDLRVEENSDMAMVQPTFDLARSPADMAQLITQHTVLPSQTDPAISDPNDANLTYAPSNDNGRLMIFFPGTGGKPSGYSMFMEYAASKGYHVLGVMYPNDFGTIKGLCDNDLTCFEPLRNELYTGQDTSTKVSVNADNSIHNRMGKLLAYMVKTYPDEGWDQYVFNGEPAWNKLTIAGHSQGGGNAAYIAGLQKVARVVMFSSASDASDTTTPPTPAAYLTTHVTPSDRYFGMDHTDDNTYFADCKVDWKALGMTGTITDADSEFPPYGNTQQLTGTRTLTSPHNQIVSNSTPLVGGVPVYQAAWQYLIGP